MNGNDGRDRWQRAVADAVTAGVPGAEQLARKLDPCKVTAEQYGELCDVACRLDFGWPIIPGEDGSDPYLHTSDLARTAANRIIEILGLEIEDPR